MPRYFFHQCIEDRMVWDRAGLQLPNLLMAPWADILSRKLQSGQILVVRMPKAKCCLSLPGDSQEGVHVGKGRQVLK